MIATKVTKELMVELCNVKQVAESEETETMVNIDYMGRQLIIRTNKATLIRRIAKKGYEPCEVGRYKTGEVYNVEWRLPNSAIGQFMRTGYFKFD